jgi:hypothetical protein
MSSAARDRAWLAYPPFIRFRKALDHAVISRAKDVAQSKGLSSATEKHKAEHVARKIALRFAGAGCDISTFGIVRAAAAKNDRAFLGRVKRAYTRGAKPLVDDADLSILLFWDGFEFLFSRSKPPFYGIAVPATRQHRQFPTSLPFPGLVKWTDAAAAACIAFIEERSEFYSESAKPKGEKGKANRRPYQTYKKRRQRLGLRPHKRPTVTAAKYDFDADTLTITKRTGGNVEIHRFVPTTK